MITAIYAHKSTEPHGVADEQKSVARQIEHARQYAARKGWTAAGELFRSHASRDVQTLIDMSADWQRQFHAKGWQA